jgi:hypothetical protein
VCARDAANSLPGRGQKSSPRPDTRSTRTESQVRVTQQSSHRDRDAHRAPR